MTRAQEELAVIAAAYREFEPDTTSTDTLYIAAQYYGSEEPDAVAETIKGLRNDVSLDLAQAYAEANTRGGQHAGPPATRRKDVVFAADSLLAKTNANHPPILRYSRPGLNARGDSAVVQISVVCGGLCGHGEMMLLAKGSDGQWHLVKRFGQFVM